MIIRHEDGIYYSKPFLESGSPKEQWLVTSSSLVGNPLSLRFGDESDRLLPSGFSEIANRDQNLFKAS